jgi:6-phosphogluconolactonase (cycloisomerase 2 family)
MIRRLSVVLAVVFSYACGAAETPTGPPPTPAPSRADQAFMAVGYSCAFGTDDRRFSVHEIDLSTGAVRPAALATGSSLWAGVIDFGPHRPNGRLVYVARYPAGGRGNETLQVQSLDATGTLHAVGEMTMPAGRAFYPGRIDSAGRYMVVAGRLVNAADYTKEDPQISLHLLDANGMPRAASSTAAGLASVIDMVIAPNGRMVYAASTLSPPLAAYSVQPDTGTIQPIPGSPFAGSGRGSFTMAIHPSGRFLYTADYNNDRPNQVVWLHQIDGTTGEPRFAGGFRGDSAGYMAIEPSRRYLYLATWTGQIWAYTIDGGSGALTPLPGYPIAAAWRAADSATIDATGRYLYVTAQPSQGSRTPANTPIHAYRIDSATGTLSAVAGFPMNPSTEACAAIAVASR